MCLPANPFAPMFDPHVKKQPIGEGFKEMAKLTQDPAYAKAKADERDAFLAKVKDDTKKFEAKEAESRLAPDAADIANKTAGLNRHLARSSMATAMAPAKPVAPGAPRPMAAPRRPLGGLLGGALPYRSFLGDK